MRWTSSGLNLSVGAHQIVWPVNLTGDLLSLFLHRCNGFPPLAPEAFSHRHRSRRSNRRSLFFREALLEGFHEINHRKPYAAVPLRSLPGP